MYLTVVAPLYNEEDNVERLYSSIVDAMASEGYEYEIIFVDDGSQDNTLANARRIAAKDERLRVVEFRRNYGQTPAMAAGIDQAAGEIIVTMDGDLQNDPRDIPNFVEKINEGFDIVVGWRFNRKDKLISRKIPSKIANWLIGKVTGVPIKDNGCSLKAYRAKMIQHVPLYNEMHRFIPAMVSMTGARIAEIKVRHHARLFGESKYGLSRVYKVLLDLLSIKTLVGFSQRPLVWFGYLAIPLFFLSGLTMLAALAPWVLGRGAISVPLAGSGILFGALGIILVLNGAIGELIFSTGRTGNTSKFVSHKNIEF